MLKIYEPLNMHNFKATDDIIHKLYQGLKRKELYS